MAKEYIERGALRKRLEDFSEWCRDGRKEGVDFVLDCPLPNTPAADVVEVVHGYWIDKCTGAYGRMQSWCSACGKHSGIGGIESNRHKPYCPNCGAKMDGERKEV